MRVASGDVLIQERQGLYEERLFEERDRWVGVRARLIDQVPTLINPKVAFDVVRRVRLPSFQPPTDRLLSGS